MPRFKVSLIIVLLCLSCSTPFSGELSAQVKRPKSEPLFRVQSGGRWGYINKQGRVVITPRFLGASDFSEGLAVVSDDAGSFYIDAAGKVITGKSRYGYADSFSEGLAAVQLGRDGKLGFIDKTGRWAIKPTFDGSDGRITGSFKDGLAFVQLNQRIGFIDTTGKFVIEPSFDADVTQNASPFSEGLAVVRTGGKYGFIDQAGIYRIVAQYDIAEVFSEGLAGVSFDRLKFGFINSKGEMVIEPRFDWAGHFHEGLATVNVGMAWHGHQKSGGKWGFIDKSGKLVIAVQYEVANSFSEGLAPVRIDGHWGYIERTGRVQIKPQFDWAERFSNGVARVTVAGKTGYIVKTGRYIWVPTN